jgi:hypothetical protein
MSIRLFAGILLGLWFLLVLIGKGGFTHTLLLTGVALVAVDAAGAYRARVKE